VLEFAGRQIVQDRVATDISDGIGFFHACCTLADDDGQLDLEIELAHVWWNGDSRIGPDNGRGHLHEEPRNTLLRPADFRRMIVVVQSDADDLTRARNRCQQLYRGEGLHRTGRSLFQCALDDMARRIQAVRAEREEFGHGGGQTRGLAARCA
jgi:hypothetical protein